MDAVKYLKTKIKMTDDCRIPCNLCPLSSHNSGENEVCRVLHREHPEKAVEIVENWLKQNTKTYMQDFLEKFPNARHDDDGSPAVCRDELYKSMDYCERNDCLACWNEPMEG